MAFCPADIISQGASVQDLIGKHNSSTKFFLQPFSDWPKQPIPQVNNPEKKNIERIKSIHKRLSNRNLLI